MPHFLNAEKPFTRSGKKWGYTPKGHLAEKYTTMKDLLKETVQ
ncbi:hypothetical protein NIASO_11510 [Niabella soli DSM 19437]|uniref:Uncharacterized protein n=1 Tax=Niabella soli DSM 19437 TaxID=929713 RepID=W0F743_9BACT|nr:hypothetical protein NIASO_11510 [Niabella soli DSM 19437]